MKTRYLFSIIFVFFGLALFAAKKPDAKSVYLQQLSSSPAIEFFDDFTSLENGKAFIRMFHNDENIKIQVVVTEKGMQAKFLTQGLQVFIDISGKKGKKYTVSFPKLDREQMRGAMQMQRQPMQREPGQQRPEQREGGQGQMNMNLKPMIEQVAANSAILISGRSETLLDVGRVNIKSFGEEDDLLFTIQMPLSSLGGKVGKDAIISVGLFAEMDMSEMASLAGGMGQGGARMRADGGNAGNPGDARPSGGTMRMGGAGSMMSDLTTPFDTWVTFGLK